MRYTHSMGVAKQKLQPQKILFIILVIVLALFLAIVPLLNSRANATPATSYNLYAGQNTLVGHVDVTNDATNLYVTFVIDVPGWCLTETHLQIATGAKYGEGIPQTKPQKGQVSGNPIPGQFEYKGTHDCEKTLSYDVPYEDLGIDETGKVVIAAHAVVAKTISEEYTATPALSWQRGKEVFNEGVKTYPGYGGQWNISDALKIPLDPEQIVWDNGAYHTPSGTPVGNYASWNYRAAGGTEGPSYQGASDLRRFQASFNMPTECSEVVSANLKSTNNFDGLPINDNVYVFVNESLQFWGGTRVYTGEMSNQFNGITGLAAARSSSVPYETDGWYIPGNIPQVSDFTTGNNKIDVFTEENERWGGMSELALTLNCNKITATDNTETAWGADESKTRFVTKGNWATYFTYMLQPEWNTVALDTIQVLANNPSGKLTNKPLDSESMYKIVAEGTWQDKSVANHYIDAEYLTFDNWDTKVDGTMSNGINQKDLQIANAFVNWGNFSDTNKYTIYNYSPDADGLLSFRIFDGNASVVNPVPNASWYNDNEGYLTVTIYEKLW